MMKQEEEHLQEALPSTTTTRNNARKVVMIFSSLVVILVLLSLKPAGRRPASADQLQRPAAALRILIGILTLPEQYERRNLLRQVYGVQRRPTGTQVDVKFVFCRVAKDEQRLLVALEILRYGDIIVLECAENMNKGKTYTYFSSLPRMMRQQQQQQYDYVMKADDDTYIRVEGLATSLRGLPRQDLYYGYVIPCDSMDPFREYMSGMGYLLSWDLVEWIACSDIPRTHLAGPEDKVLGHWLRLGHKARNRFNAKWSMYNLPDPPTRCTHPLSPDTVAVHLLKTPDKWIRTLRYFNLTNP